MDLAENLGTVAIYHCDGRVHVHLVLDRPDGRRHRLNVLVSGRGPRRAGRASKVVGGGGTPATVLFDKQRGVDCDFGQLGLLGWWAPRSPAQARGAPPSLRG